MGIQIRGNTVKGAGAKNLKNHLLSLRDNDEIPVVLAGDTSQFFETAAAKARCLGRQNAFYHDQLSFKNSVNLERVYKCFDGIKAEFDPEGKHEWILVEHTKARHNETGYNKHYHVVADMIDNDSKTIDLSHNFRRHEKIARKFECEFDMALTKGKQNKAAFYMNADSPKVQEAIKEAGIMDGKLHNQVFTSTQREAAKRAGVNISILRDEMKHIKALPIDKQIKEVAKIAVKYGLEFKQGDKRDAIIIQKGRTTFSSVNRLGGLKQGHNQDFLKLIGGAIETQKRLEAIRAERAARAAVYNGDKRQSAEQDRQDRTHRQQSREDAEATTGCVESGSRREESQLSNDRANGGIGELDSSSKQSASQADRASERTDRRGRQDERRSDGDSKLSPSVAQKIISNLQTKAGWELHGDTIKQIDFSSAKSFDSMKPVNKMRSPNDIMRARASHGKAFNDALSTYEKSPQFVKSDVFEDGLAALNEATRKVGR